MRRLVLLIFLVCFGLTSVTIPSSAFAQDHNRRKPPQEGQERERGKKATPRERERPKQQEPSQREPERRREPSQQKQPRAGSRDHNRKPPSREGRAVPRPPQKYIPGWKDYSRRYHYNGKWSGRKPLPYKHRYQYKHGWRIVSCQPGYVIFVKYDYWGNPVFDYVHGYCNVPWHHHDYYFWYGY